MSTCLRAIPAALALLLAAGCGGGATDTAEPGSAPSASADPVATSTPTLTPSGSPLPTSDTDAITNLVTEVEVIHNYKVDCAQSFTAAFLKEAFGDVATCKKTGYPDLSDYPTSATVSALTGSGDSATGVVTDHGGLIDGASGAWQFTRAAGKWQVSGQSVAYLRAVAAEELGPNYHGGSAEDPFATASYRQCVLNAMQRKDDDTFKSLFFAIQVPQYIERAAGVLAGCSSSGPGGVSPFRTAFERGFRLGAPKAGLSSGVVECMIKALRTSVSDLDLIKAAFAGTTSSAAKNIDATATVEARKCAKGGGVTATSTIEAPQPRMGIRRAADSGESASSTPAESNNPTPVESAGPTPAGSASPTPS